MALEFSFNTQTTTDSGTKLDIAYGRLQVILLPNESEAQIRLDLYESSTAFFDNRKPVYIDEIPKSLHSFVGPVTGAQYSDLDMSNIHNQMRGVLLTGSDHGAYPDVADPDWLGLESYDPSNAILTVMPS